MFYSPGSYLKKGNLEEQNIRVEWLREQKAIFLSFELFYTSGSYLKNSI